MVSYKTWAWQVRIVLSAMAVEASVLCAAFASLEPACPGIRMVTTALLSFALALYLLAMLLMLRGRTMAMVRDLVIYGTVRPSQSGGGPLDGFARLDTEPPKVGFAAA